MHKLPALLGPHSLRALLKDLLSTGAGLIVLPFHCAVQEPDLQSLVRLSIFQSDRRMFHWIHKQMYLGREQHWVDLIQTLSLGFVMRRIAAFLVLLLLILTFNAYACLLPLEPESMDCTSATEQPVRQTCDAFLELGPQSHASSSHEVPTLKVDFEAAPQLPVPVLLIFLSEHPPRSADTPIHLSIPTTVLRI